MRSAPDWSAGFFLSLSLPFFFLLPFPSGDMGTAIPNPKRHLSGIPHLSKRRQ
ncbi:hypothetical protein M434DRAFT_399930 [Hypoxylon sp. CO27-5]|nr:hypothetical protein M434DRAFT_399930 [Hypoxylon sp. CO27-5]